MYSGGSVAGEASIVDREISPTLPLIFTGESKSLKFDIIFDIARFGRPHLKMQQDI